VSDERVMEDMKLAANARKTAIEECAREAENFPVSKYSQVARKNIAEAIRALAHYRPKGELK
jgi:outer membrane protein assembly factor BamD (BamD/ComL family)